MPYVSPAEARAASQALAALDDATLTALEARARAVLDAAARQEFAYAEDTTQTVRWNGETYIWVGRRIARLIDSGLGAGAYVEQIEPIGNGYALRLDRPRPPLHQLSPPERVSAEITVRADFGWQTVPAIVQEVTIDLMRSIHLEGMAEAARFGPFKSERIDDYSYTLKDTVAMSLSRRARRWLPRYLIASPTVAWS